MHLFMKTTYFVFLEKYYLFKHILKQPVYEDHLLVKTACLVFVEWSGDFTVIRA